MTYLRQAYCLIIIPMKAFVTNLDIKSERDCSFMSKGFHISLLAFAVHLLTLDHQSLPLSSQEQENSEGMIIYFPFTARRMLMILRQINTLHYTCYTSTLFMKDDAKKIQSSSSSLSHHFHRHRSLEPPYRTVARVVSSPPSNSATMDALWISWQWILYDVNPRNLWRHNGQATISVFIPRRAA